MANNDDTRLEADSLSNLKSTFKFSRRPRPPLPTEHAERAPLGQHGKKLARIESRGGLRSIFTRNKSSLDASQSSFTMKEEVFVQKGPLDKCSSLTGKTSVEAEFLAGPEYATSTTSIPEQNAAPRLSMKSKPTKIKTASRGNPKQPVKPISKPPRRALAAWDPPPLFQAYSQAIKHAQLSSSTLSADSILRISNYRKNSGIREDIVPLGLGAGQVQPHATGKTEKARIKHRRQLSGSLSKADWTQKIYMLVTSGYLLQYSGEGSFDRLPEKMMQLGKDSVAFASDVIPGKHWVLQISQAMDSDGIPAPDPRSLLSRLTFRNADYRRTATSFLLILDSAEDLESWIITVRREIEALGGKKYVTETGKPKADEEDTQLKAQPSQRYLLVQRDPDRFSNPPTPRTLSCNPQWRHSDDFEYQGSTLPSFRPQLIVGPSADGLSVATSSASYDSQQYEALKDNSFRLSYVSSGQRTLVTSQGSSPACSPTQETFIAIEESRISDHIEEARPRPSATAISDRRRSTQTIQKSTVQNQALEFYAISKLSKNRPHSTYGSTSRVTIAQSPSTPNFSVPHSASKRYTLAKIPDNSSTPIPTQPRTTTREQDTCTGGDRKSPPAPLNVSQLSPVPDLPSLEKQQPGPISTGSSFQNVSRRSSMVEIPLSSQCDSARRISIPAVESPSIAQNSVHSTPRQLSLPVFPKVVPEPPKTPIRAPPIQPVSPRMIPLPPSPHVLPFQLETVPINDPSGPLISQDDSRAATAITKPRRPASMQVLIKSSTNVTGRIMPPPNGTLTAISLPSTEPTTPLQALLYPASPQPLSAPHLPLSTSSPSIERLKSGGAMKDLLNRRSMPQLVIGPPPAPPPNYALPPIPGGNRGSLALKGGRRSLKV